MMRVLIVDDEQAIREGIKRAVMTAFMDWDVETAESGEEALRLLDGHKPDIVLMDVMMPGMSGLELLRLGGVHKSIRWVVISAYSDFQFAQQALQYGARDYMLKPIGKPKLIELLNKLKEELDEERDAWMKQQKMLDQLNEAREAVSRLLHAEAPPYEKQPDQMHPKDLIESATQYIMEHYRENLSLEKVAAAVYLNPVYFSQLFKKTKGTGYKDYVIQLRLEKAKLLLKSSDLKVTEVAEQVGYQDMRHFTQVFRKMVLMTPSEYRREQSR